MDRDQLIVELTESREVMRRLYNKYVKEFNESATKIDNFLTELIENA